MLRIELLGGLRLETGDEVLDAPESRRARLLLAWLALHPGRHGRSRVAGALRPDVPEEDARRNLRQAAWHATKALGDAADGAFIATRGEIGLDPRATEIDVDQLRERAAGGDLDAARALREKPLLPEHDDDWLVDVREHLRSELAETAARRAVVAEADGELTTAVAWARERASADPLSEVAQRELMRLLALTGDRAAAVQVATELRRRLDDELGLVPSPETRAAFELLLQDEPTVAAAPVQPVVPVAVTAPVPAAGRPELPAAIESARAEPLFGRDDELAQLVAAFAAPPSVALIAGEPGIGKTRLTVEAAAGAFADGAVVLYGRCAESGLGYAPFAEALAAESLPLTSLPPVHVSALARLVPRLVPHAEPGSGDADPELARHRLFEAVCEALIAASADRRVVLVIDDLHWAEPPTVALLAHVVRRMEDERVSVACTYRGAEVERGLVATLLAELNRRPGAVRLALEPLDTDAIASLIDRRPGVQADEGLAQQIRDRTGGNALFAVEVLRDIEESGGLADPDAVPDAVRELIERRVERLGDGAVAVLRAAAIAGDPFDSAALEVGSELPGDDVVDALDAALGAQLVREDGGRYRFTHALVRDALEGSMSALRRARMHARLGAGLAAAGAPAHTVAHHLLSAGAAADSQQTLEWVLRAAAADIEALAYEEAASIAARALEVVPATDELRAKLLFVRGDALDRAGRRRDARAAFLEVSELARSMEDWRLLARAALGYKGLAVELIAPDGRAVALIEEALERLDEDELALRARLLAALALDTYYAIPDRAAELSAAAVVAARESGDDATLAHTLNARHVALWNAEGAWRRLEVATEMRALAQRAGDRVAALQALHWRVLDRLELGLVDAAELEMAEYERECDTLRLIRYGWYVPLWRSSLAALRGDFDESARLAQIAIELGRQVGDPNADPYHDIHEWMLLVERGRWHELDLPKAYEMAAASPAGRGAWLPTLAWAHAERGELEQAVAAYDEVAEDDFAAAPRDANWPTLCELAEACAALGRADSVPILTELLAPHAELTPVLGRGIYCFGPVAYYLGRLATTAGEHVLAIERFEQALEICERIRAYPRTALTRVRLADALDAVGAHPERAATERAHGLAELKRLDILAPGRHAAAR